MKGNGLSFPTDKENGLYEKGFAIVKYRVELTKEEREELIAKVSKGKGTAAEIKRANLLLAVDKGEFAELCLTDEEAARLYHSTPKTIYNLKKKLVEEGFENVLKRKKRSRPGNLKIDGEAEAKIIALTCTEPPEGHARWTLRLIAEKSVELGYVESISHVSIGNLLKKRACTPGNTKCGVSLSNPLSM